MTSPECPALIGRDTELRALRDALDRAGSGHGGLVFVVGEAGIGKSRLLRQLSEDAARRPRTTRVAIGRATATATAPYRALTEALFSLQRAQRGKSDPLNVLTGRDIGLAEATTRGEAILQVLATAAEHSELLLILDDSQWSDPDTLSVIEYLADNLAGTRVLCVVALRDQPTTPAAQLVHRLVERRVVEVLTLSRLKADGIAAMVLASRPDASPELITRLQQTSDGVPFLVEELLDSPGVPRSLLDSVRARLDTLTPSHRQVIEVAAVLGHRFDWHLLAAATAQTDSDVAGALEEGHRTGLLDVEAGSFHFRHALSRDAVLAGLMPPRRVQLARTALAVLDGEHAGSDVDDAWRDTAADLATQAGDARRAAQLWLASGRTALARGAIATAIESLQRSAEQARDGAARLAARGDMVRAFALAGRVDDAFTLGSAVIAQSPPDDAVDLHLVLAQACADAERWPAAQTQLSLARELIAAHGEQDRRQQANLAVLDAEIALSQDDPVRCRELAGQALSLSAGLAPEVECQAWQLVGRSHRAQDLGRARDGFEQALTTAQAARLPVSALRALHELGTLDMFDHGGTDRLRQAAQAAQELGALSTGATIQLHLAAAYDQRFDNPRLYEHAARARDMAIRLRMEQLTAVATWFEAHFYAQVGDLDAMEDRIRVAKRIGAENPYLDGWIWMGARGLRALLDEDHSAALHWMARGVEVLETLPPAGPAQMRGVWPLLAAVYDDPRTAAALTRARQDGVTVNRLNAGLLGLADAVVAGRAGDSSRAELLTEVARTELVPFVVWGHLGMRLTAQAALSDGWGSPAKWLDEAAAGLAGPETATVAQACERLRDSLQPGAGNSRDLTAREHEVLSLVAAGLANKEIAKELGISARTVEKHVEALLRKTGRRSRTQLVSIGLKLSG